MKLAPCCDIITRMPATNPQYTREEVARLGVEIFDRHIRPMLRPEDDGKFVAIDIGTGDHEIDEDDYAAVTRCGDTDR